MGMNKVERLDEGPLDFIRGAGREVGRGVAGAAKTVQRGVGNVVQAGRAASMEAEFEKGAMQLAQLLQQRAALSKQSPAQPQQAAQQQAPAQPQQAAQQQAPAQQPLTLQRMDRRARKPKASKPATGAPAAFRGAGRPTVQGAHGPEFRFEQYLQAVMADELNEGAWDFIKGAGGEAVNKARQWVNNYANRPSLIRDLYHAGRDASAQGDARKMAANSAQQAEQVQAQIKELGGKLRGMLQQMGPNGKAILDKVVRATDRNHRDTLYAILTRQA